MISAPRSMRTVERTLAELRRGGFLGVIHVFQEPGTGIVPAPGVVVHTNSRRLGMWHNWRQAAEYLRHNATGDFLLVCEDDLRLCPAAFSLLSALLENAPPRFGFASLYTPWHNVSWHGNHAGGWQELVLGRMNWGSLAYCFSRASLEQILNCRAVQNHDTDKDTDAVLGAACVELGLAAYFHRPSLAAHAGAGCSSVGHVPLAESAAIEFDPNLGSVVLQ